MIAVAQCWALQVNSTIFPDVKPDRDEALYTVYLVSYDRQCGGTVVGRRWILTAASCVYDRPPHHFNILTGLHNYYLEQETTEFTLGKRLILHPYFNASASNETRMMYDVALIRTNSPIRLGNKLINTVDQLATERAYKAIQSKDRSCYIYGHGLVKYGNILQRNWALHKVSVDLVNCSRGYDDLRNNADLQCIQTFSEDASLCSDYGTAIVCNQAGQWQHIGHVVGEDPGELCRGRLGVILKTPAILPWIESIIH